jgi:hypothetical protein
LKIHQNFSPAAGRDAAFRTSLDELKDEASSPVTSSVPKDFYREPIVREGR